jgi:glutathione dehydrogenase/transferase
LKSTDESAVKEAALVEELEKLDKHLRENGPFLKGGKVSAGDLSLAPKLYHMETALKHFKVIAIV